MDRPVRVQLRRSKGWQMPENTVVVSRPGPLGNPFIVGRHGTRAECVRFYRLMLGGTLLISCDAETFLAQRAYRERLASLLPDLRGKNLACWCPLDSPCHADVLLEIANAPESDRG
jgi:hypothetical protein